MTATRKDLAGLELALNELELDNHQPVVAGLWRLIAQAKAAPADPGQGEAVEVVGTRYSRITENGRNVSLVRLSRSRRYVGWHAEDLMTVAQHNRIMAAAKPDAELVELLIEVMDWAVKLEPIPHSLIDRIDAKLKEYE